MDMNNEEIQNEQNNELETPETPDQPELEKPKTEESEKSLDELESTAPAKPEKKPPSKFVRFLKKAGIVLGIIAVIFFAGFLTDHFTRYRPLSEELDQTRTELEQAEQDLSELEAENEALTRANRAATDEIADLEEALTEATANLKFYQVLVDVNAAQLELFLENIEGTQAALADTKENLDDLLPFITELDPELALSLPRRLDLIISGIERDPETARIDLELLSKDLLELEPLLVNE